MNTDEHCLLFWFGRRKGNHRLHRLHGFLIIKRILGVLAILGENCKSIQKAKVRRQNYRAKMPEADKISLGLRMWGQLLKW
jgi:hypothetical protein